MSVPQRILVVDDEANIVHLIRAYLERNGFHVLTAHDGDMALERIAKEQPDLIILDLMLPGVSGEDICDYIRQVSRIPIIMLTAKTAEEQRVAGLDLGADDYVAKPFSPKELVARVKAVLRRTSDHQETLTASGGAILVDLEKHQAEVAGHSLALTPTEYRLLVTFLKNRGKAFSRRELAELVFGWDYEGYEETIYVHVKNLRQKLGDHAFPLKTVYGVGYRWDE